MIRIGVIGYGRWGPNLTRCIAANQAFVLTAVCDVSPERLNSAAVDYRGVRLESNPDLVVNDPGVDAVVLATPAITHYAIARDALRAGKHVLVEKPVALASGDVLRLIEDADRRGLVLMIDHTYLFSPPVRAMSGAVQTGALGTIRSVESLRVNTGSGPYDVNVLWDLAYHDFSIIDYVFRCSPRGISATGYVAEPGGLDYRAELSLYFPGGLTANVRVDRSGSSKIRHIVVTGTESTLTFDDLEPTAKIKIHGSESHLARTNGYGGETSLLPYEKGEPLKAVTDHFAACVISGTRPLSDGAAGFRVVRLLEAASRSMVNGGRIISLEPDGII